MQNFRLGNAEARGGERPLLQDGELLVRVREGDGALEAEVGEGVYYGGAGGGGAGSLEGVEGELEGGGLVAGVGVLVCGADGGVEGGEGGGCGPVLVDGLDEDGAGDEAGGCFA